jgi:hypothetical protein
VASAAAHYDALPLAGRGTSREAGCITIHGKACRALVRCVGTAFEFHPDRPVDVGRCLWAQLTKGRIAQAPGGLEIRGSDERARRARALCPTSCQAIPAGHVGGGLKIGSQNRTVKIGHRRSQNRAKRIYASRHDHTSER